MKNLIAKNNGISLFDHSINCAEMALKNFNSIISKENEHYNDLILPIYFGALFHDIGKAYPEFQSYLKGETTRPFSHSYMSSVICHECFKLKTYDVLTNKLFWYTVLHHHPVYDTNNINDFLHKNVIDLIEELLEYTKNKHQDLYERIIFNKKQELITNCIDETYYFDKTEGIYNEKFLYIRNLIIESDINTSSGKKIDTNINLPQDFIFTKPKEYDNRYYDQKEDAEILSNEKIIAYDAPTGFGKTLLGVIYAIINGKKCYWVCPRNSITESMYDSIKQECIANNFPISVSFMCGGVYKDCHNCSIDRLNDNHADITVINIDSFLRPLFNTDSNKRNFAFVDSTLIFDEYDEHISDNAANALFQYIINMRKKYTDNTHTLLLSATKNKQLLKKYEIKCLSPKNKSKFLSKKYKINYCHEFDIDDFTNIKNTNSIIFPNSVKLVQELKEHDKVNICIHSHFLEKDKDEIFNYIKKTHNKKAQEKERMISVASTTITGTGCDFSFKNGYWILPTPSYWIQQIGRINRFNEYEYAILNIFNSVKDKSKLKSEKSTIDIYYDNDLNVKFLSFLKKELPESEYSLETIYEKVEMFEEEHNEEYKKMFNKKMKDSMLHLSSLNYSYSNKDNTEEDNVMLSSKNNIRELNPDKIWLLINGDMETPIEYDIKNNKTNNLSKRDSLFIYYKSNRKNIHNIIKNNIDYFHNIRSYTTFNKKDDTICFNELIKKAKNSKTPFVILHGAMTYDNEIGLCGSI